jgi:hypothetical protein
MEKHKFTWRWVGAWLEYKLDGKPFFALINPVIWDRYVTEASSGEIELTEEELFGDDLNN